MSVETLLEPVTYGPGNPLPLRGLSEDSYKTSVYCAGEALRKSGQTNIKDAAFINVMGMEAGEGHEIASISRDLFWDGETRIEAFGETLAQEIAGMPVKAEWFGPYQLTVYIEGYLDPEEIVRKLVYSPTRVYKEHMNNLLPDAQKDVEVFEHDFLTGPHAKGKRFVDIFNGYISGQRRAFQIGEGRGFVWGYKKTKTDEMEAINLDNTGQTITELTLSDEMDQDMKGSLLATQEFFKGVSQQRRWVIRFTFDPTRTCCLNATAAQSYKSIFDSKSGIQSTGIKLSSFFEVDFIATDACSNCGKSKNASSEGERCSCKE